MQVVVMAGGRGERLTPVRGGRPKPLVGLRGRPMLAWSLEGIVRRGGTHLCLCVGPSATPFRSLIEADVLQTVRVDLVTEESPLGTIGALLRCPLDKQRPCLVINGDVLTTLDLRELAAHQMRSGADWSIATHEAAYRTRFGELEADERGQLRAYREKPWVCHQFSSGIHAVSARARAFLAATPEVAALPLPEMLMALRTAGLSVDLFPHRELWIDINDPDDLAIAERELQEEELQAIVGTRPTRRSARPHRFGERGWAY